LAPRAAEEPGMTVNLEAELRNRGLSIRKAAIQIGISRTTLEKALGGGSLHPETAKRIADFVEVKVTDIWPVDEPEERAA
jgi:lambda repressor-like predicted transcriptional regulator